MEESPVTNSTWNCLVNEGIWHGEKEFLKAILGNAPLTSLEIRAARTKDLFVFDKIRLNNCSIETLRLTDLQFSTDYNGPGTPLFALIGQLQKLQTISFTKIELEGDPIYQWPCKWLPSLRKLDIDSTPNPNPLLHVLSDAAKNLTELKLTIPLDREDVDYEFTIALVNQFKSLSRLELVDTDPSFRKLYTDAIRQLPARFKEQKEFAPPPLSLCFRNKEITTKDYEDFIELNGQYSLDSLSFDECRAKSGAGVAARLSILVKKSLSFLTFAGAAHDEDSLSVAEVLASLAESRLQGLDLSNLVIDEVIFESLLKGLVNNENLVVLRLPDWPANASEADKRWKALARAVKNNTVLEIRVADQIWPPQLNPTKV